METNFHFIFFCMFKIICQFIFKRMTPISRYFRLMDCWKLSSLSFAKYFQFIIVGINVCEKWLSLVFVMFTKQGKVSYHSCLHQMNWRIRLALKFEAFISQGKQPFGLNDTSPLSFTPIVYFVGLYNDDDEREQKKTTTDGWIL